MKTINVLHIASVFSEKLNDFIDLHRKRKGLRPSWIRVTGSGAGTSWAERRRTISVHRRDTSG
jgi:hypothetical protein